MNEYKADKLGYYRSNHCGVLSHTHHIFNYSKYPQNEKKQAGLVFRNCAFSHPNQGFCSDC